MQPNVSVEQDNTTSNRYQGYVTNINHKTITFKIDIINQNLICSINYRDFKPNNAKLAKHNFSKISYQHRKHTNWKTRYNHQLDCIEITRQFNKTTHQNLNKIVKPFILDIELINNEIRKDA